MFTVTDFSFFIKQKELFVAVTEDRAKAPSSNISGGRRFRDVEDSLSFWCYRVAEDKSFDFNPKMKMQTYVQYANFQK